MGKKWILPPPNDATAARLAAALTVSELTARLLANRGLTEPDPARRFLQPSLHELTDPCDHPVVSEAARFLLDAARSGKRLVIFGDYDADGICAAALMARCFEFLNTDAAIYIPHRVDDGYGLSCDALQELANGGADVVVSVDCGITSVDEVAFARKLGMEIVVTDHHQPGDELPAATHLLNPKLDGCGFGYEFLAGVGVAFKLMWAIGQQLSENRRVSDQFRDLLMEALSLVAVGTVADVAPMRDENRILVRYGLKTLAAYPCVGLRALMATSRLQGNDVSEHDVAFRLAPRLNAAGRMGNAQAAVDILTTAKEEHARDLAQHLERQNRLRMKAQRATLQEAEEMLEGQSLDDVRCIVLASPKWHLGVLGPVASRLAEQLWRPAFLLAADGDKARGSGRSVPGFPLLAAVRECADLLDRYGGHEGAAGVALPLANVDAFRDRLNDRAGRTADCPPPTPQLSVDTEIDLAALNIDLLREVEMLAPFGPANPRPLLAASDLRLVGAPRIVGSSRNHLAFMVRQGVTTLRCIGMRKADWIGELRGRKGQPFSLAFQPFVNAYRGRNSIELRADDFQWDDARDVERRAC